jgi:hypothetical protein
MMRDPMPIVRGTRVRLPSGNVVEVLEDADGGPSWDNSLNCAYRRYAGDNKAARVGVTLCRHWLEQYGEIL